MNLVGELGLGLFDELLLPTALKFADDRLLIHQHLMTPKISVRPQRRLGTATSFDLLPRMPFGAWQVPSHLPEGPSSSLAAA